MRVLPSGVQRPYNGNLGQWAEFVIENDTGETVPNLNDWPPFATVTMSGSALVVRAAARAQI